LLPPDFLRQIAEGRDKISGLTPEAYHLPGTERLNEAASRSWNRLLGAWGAFQAASQSLAETDPGTGITREKWLLPLFQELGYGRLLTAKTFEIEGKPFPISHAWQHTPIHLVGRNVDLDRRSPGVAVVRDPLRPMTPDRRPRLPCPGNRAPVIVCKRGDHP
jgi:hypothetical protein